jgi:pimeloyl-ACP methyl ester carboxylesterase
MEVHLLRFALLIALVGSGCQSSGRSTETDSTRVLDSDEVARLLKRPVCLEDFGPSSGAWVVHDVPVESNGIVLSGQLYLPANGERFPLVILIPGGFNEEDLIMQAPRYYAPRLATCGVAAYVYWKRGTGPSGGVYAEATYDDFADDVVSIAKRFTAHPKIDSRRIGLYGGSAGGLIGPIAAARSEGISFVISASGPIVSSEEENNYNIEHALRMRGYADSLVMRVMPLWRRHHAAWARSDTAGHEAVAAEVKELRKRYDPHMLPTPYREVFADSGLVFLWPVFRSFHRDYLSELKKVNARWLSIYGELDEVVPVSSCVNNIVALGNEGVGRQYDIIVLPGVGHSFVNAETRRRIPVIRILVNWLQETVLPPGLEP